MSSRQLAAAAKLNPALVDSDIDGPRFASLCDSSAVAIDIETTGLDWWRDRIGTVQLYASDVDPIVLQPRQAVPHRLKTLLEDGSVVKVFHHAVFDLRFMMAHWGVSPVNVQCTKIASKITYHDLPDQEHSLDRLLARVLDIHISKDLQRSDWTAQELSAAQIRYAASDVCWLLDLIDVLRTRAEHMHLSELVESCFAHIPVRVALEVGSYGDVFTY